MIDIDGTWDIETEHWDRFVCGGISDRFGTYISWNEDQFARTLLSREGTYWAHNGGGFDHLWLASWCARRGISWRGIPRGSSIVCMYVGKKLTLRDSKALWPDRLAIVSKLGSQTKIELDLPNGYESIRRDAPPEHRSIINAYLEADCVGLRSSLEKLCELATSHGVEVRTTVGASAWATALQWCPGLSPLQRDVAEYHAIRSAYYGGRTQCLVTRVPSGHRHDIHSAYPAALASITLPVGDVSSRGAGAAYLRGDAGVFTARVSVPECHVPPLPCREEERLTYPFGDILGAWTGDELRHAESHGARVTSIVNGLYWRERAPLLKPFADRVWALREWAKANAIEWYPWVKWLANSLTGKLAMKPEQETLYFDPNGEIPDPPPGKPPHRVIGQVHDGVVYTMARDQVAPCAWVEHAAHLTAHTRTELHSQLIHAGEGAVYCDTDAVYSEQRLTRRMGDELGEWAHEGEMRSWECLAPKLYRYHTPDGKTIVKGKGMSGLTPEGFDALKAGDGWTVDRGVVGAMKAIASGEPFRRKVLTRRHLGAEGSIGDRVLESDGIHTRAPRRSFPSDSNDLEIV